MAYLQPALAPRIDFGKVVHCPGREGKSLFSHSVSGHDFSGAHNNRIGHDALSQIRLASFMVRAERDPGSGPLSDKDGRLRELGEILFRSCLSDDERISRLIAMVNDYKFFRFCPDLLGEDKPFSATDMLSQDLRIAKDTGSGESSRLFTDILEPYIFGVAVLRASGLLALPAFAILHAETGEEHSPLVAVVDPEGPVPLRTFSLLSTHPPMHHLALLGDRSVDGLAHLMNAQNRFKAMLDMIMEGIVNKKAPDEFMLERMSGRISESLLRCHTSWPDNLLIGDHLERMGNMLFQRVSSVAICAGFEGHELQGMLQSAAIFSAGLIQRIEDSFHARKRIRSGWMH